MYIKYKNEFDVRNFMRWMRKSSFHHFYHISSKKDTEKAKKQR